jgi:uncharacterized integral membrane protein
MARVVVSSACGHVFIPNTRELAHVEMIKVFFLKLLLSMLAAQNTKPLYPNAKMTSHA